MGEIRSRLITQPHHILLTAVPTADQQDRPRARVLLNANNISEVTEADPHSEVYSDRFCLVVMDRGGQLGYIGVAEPFDEILELLGTVSYEEVHRPVRSSNGAQTRE